MEFRDLGVGLFGARDLGILGLVGLSSASGFTPKKHWFSGIRFGVVLNPEPKLKSRAIRESANLNQDSSGIKGRSGLPIAIPRLRSCWEKTGSQGLEVKDSDCRIDSDPEVVAVAQK